MTWREQAVTIPVEPEGLVLEGIWLAGGRRGAVVAPAHPQLGGSLDHPVVNEIADALHRARLASLRFNWRGVGASQGSASGDPGCAERDFGAALDQLAETLDGPILGAGYSFGAGTALRVALIDARIRNLILVAPPLEMLRDQPIADFAGSIHVLVGGSDEFAPAKDLSELLAPLVNVRLDVIANADHFFVGGGLTDLAELLRAAVG